MRRLATIGVLGSLLALGLVVTLLRDGHGCGTTPRGPAALVAVDRETGDTAWVTLAGRIEGHTQLGDVLAVRDESGAVRAYDLSTGAIRWCRELAASRSGSDNGWGLTSAGSVIASFDGGGAVVGLDVSTGAERWRTPVNLGEGFMDGDAEPWVWVYDGSAARTNTLGLDPGTGAVVPDASPVPLVSGPAAPTTVGDLTMSLDLSPRRVRAQITVTMTDLADDVLWQDRLPGFFAELVDSDAGPLVLTSPDSSVGHDLLVFDARTGEERWHRAGVELAPRLATGDDLFVVAGTRLEAIDLANGNLRWSVDTGSPGRGGRYSDPGGAIEVIATDEVVVGMIEAREPYRD